MSYIVAGLIVLGLISLLIGLIVERNLERARCKRYMSEVDDHDSGAG